MILPICFDFTLYSYILKLYCNKLLTSSIQYVKCWNIPTKFAFIVECVITERPTRATEPIEDEPVENLFTSQADIIDDKGYLLFIQGMFN